MPIPRRHFDRATLAITQLVQVEVVIALRRHQFQMITHRKAILHPHFGQAVDPLAAQFADELLALGHRVATLVVLIFIMHMPAQEALGISALGQ
ncbi:hypothetical protein D3C76_1577380 [compost metagenome]